MATSSKIAETKIPETKTIDILTKDNKGSVPFSIPDPVKEPQSLTIYQNQTLIPLTIKDCGFAYLGPYNPPAGVNSYRILFPTHPDKQILAYQESINADFIRETHEAFTFAVPTGKDEFLTWLKRVNKVKEES